RECTGSANPHQIVIGPRGSGKTSLLLRVAVEVCRDAGLRSNFFPIVFAEESYEVSTAGEFWLVCLSRLADQVPHKEDAPDLRRTYEDLCTIQDDQTLAERCLGALLDFSDREGKRLVLMVENLNMMFRDMADPDAGWRLRKILQNEPRIILLASATSRFDEIDHPDHALYDLFRILLLRPLDTNECTALWEAVVGKCPPPETIRSLEILTGGSPRLIAIVARFDAVQSFRELMAELLDLVDDHTEYFKSHIESLPAQERRVYLVLADLWKPATTREIAVRARLETSKCSAQLTRLIERGVVQVMGGTARRKQYYLTERLYNIYYLLRRSRGQDSLIQALIQFMESYYSGTELKDIGVHIAREAGSFGGEMQTMARIALAQMIRLPVLAEYREELLTTIEQTELLAAKEIFDKAVALKDQNRPEEALSAFDEVVRRFAESKMPKVSRLVAMALFERGLTLNDLDRPEDALTAYDEVVRRFGDSKTPDVLGLVAQALVEKGFILVRLDRTEDALATFDEVVRRSADSESFAGRVATEHALLGKAYLELECRRYKAAIKTACRVLDLCHTASPEYRWLAHLIRAKATLANGDLSASEQDIAAILTILPSLGSLPKEILEELIEFSIEIGPERMVELIQASPSANLLLPLTTALEQELGREPRVALEVAEVAEDIRKDLAKLRET
ncbi:MAG: tetratricopeptide repeat protein, partial [Candidatus Latescibacteria bacterium]|nr:tetratricopeptide repeat protein [Candidatus Latescibacterota bacterium]